MVKQTFRTNLFIRLPKYPFFARSEIKNAPKLEDEGTLKGSLQEGNFVLVSWNNIIFPGKENLSDEDEERIKIIDSAERGSNSGAISSDNQNKCLNVKRKEFTKFRENDHAFENTAFHSSEIDISSLRQTSSTSTMNGITSSEENTALNHDSPQSELIDNVHRISVHRRPADFSYLERKYGMLPRENLSQQVTRTLKSHCICSISCFMSFVTSLFPVLNWLPNYKLGLLIPDLISGFTISILHIPQGMAYGILASLKAENGLYVSFFPVLVYFLLGTSRHISIGTFAVISLMISSSVARMDAVDFREENVTLSNGTQSMNTESMYLPPTHLEVGTSMAICVGLWQLVLGVFQMGVLAVVLSDQLVSGFSTGAATHVAVSQLVELFGVKVGRHSEVLKLIYMLQEICTELTNTNIATIIISAVAIFVLAVVKEQVNERFRDKLKMPIPVDLVVVIVATLISYLADFHGNYNVTVMGNIPTGIPSPSPPRLDIVPQLLMDSFAVAIVAFAISLSMAKIFAKKHKYEIRPSQELIALGCANVFSSFFACYPCSASLSRSLVQERAGGQTQVAGIVSCCILLLVLLVLAPMFYCLPKCILSAVILVALKGMFMQVRDFFKAWKISKIDSLIWLVTFLSTVLLDVSFGLLAGVIFTLLTVIARTISPTRSFLGNIFGTDLYLDIKRYNEAKEIRGIKIFHFESALYFINRELFKNWLLAHVPISKCEVCEEDRIKCPPNEIHHIIIDCSSFAYVDMSGLEVLLEIMTEYKETGITVYLAGCSVSMSDMMERDKFFSRMPQEPSVFPTIHDAVQFCHDT